MSVLAPWALLAKGLPRQALSFEFFMSSCLCMSLTPVDFFDVGHIEMLPTKDRSILAKNEVFLNCLE